LDSAAIRLGVPVSIIRDAADKILSQIAMRKGMLLMEADVFNKNYLQAKDEIESMRNEWRVESNKIRESASATYRDLMPRVNNFWSELETIIEALIDDYDISSDDLKKKNNDSTREKLQTAIKEKEAEVIKLFGEQLQHEIEKSFAKEANRLSAFQDYFHEKLTSVQDLFGAKAGVVGGNVAMGAAMDFMLVGTGSAYVGYKTAGIKGALAGGALGIGTKVGVVMLGLKVASLAFPPALPVVLLVGAGGSLLSSLVSKKITNYVWGDEVHRFKDEYKKMMSKTYAEMKATGEMSKQVDEQIRTMFASLQEFIQAETERVLRDTQKTLDVRKEELVTGELNLKTKQEELDLIITDAEQMIKNANNVSKGLEAILNRR